MLISGLKLAGFKSFADPTELTVEPGLTGVVGPNGCGKSNVVDAVRWVMGESSARGLRGAEMDDVIFAGSDARPAFDFAEVGLTLEPRPDEGGDRLEVARRIGRGVGSSFRINGKEARSKDIARMLADAAAGARSAAIVGQGQIGALVEARPHERQRLLAEAAGIAGLQSRRREAELRLEAVQANLTTAGERVAILQDQEKRLEKQAREASRFKSLNARHRELQVLLLLARFRQAEKRVEAVAERSAAAAAAHSAAAEARREAEAHADRVRAKLEQLLTAERRETGEHARLAERLAAREQAAAQALATMERLGEEASQLDRDLDREEGQAVAAAEMLAKLETAQAEAPAERQALIEAAENADAQAAAARDELERVETAWRDAASALASAKADLAALQATVERDAEAIRAMERQSAELAAALEALNAPVDGADGLADLEAQALTARASMDEIEAEIAAAEAALDEAAGNRGTLEVDAQAASERARIAEAERQSVEERSEAQRVRRAELAERLAAVTSRLTALDDEATRAGTALSGLALDRARSEAENADLAVAESAGRRQRAADAVAAARTGLAAENDLLREAEGVWTRLAAEREALAATAGDAAEIADPLIDRLRVPAALERAVAAVLGDDVAASLDPTAAWSWRGSPGPAGGQPLPVGAEPLSQRVDTPPALAARFEQTGLVDDAATAQSLAGTLRPGQRLTTVDGGLWRWDGLVRLPEMATPADQRARLGLRAKALEGELAAAQSALASASEREGVAGAALDAALSELGAAETAHAEAVQIAGTAAAGRNDKEKEAARLEARLQALADERQRLESERQGLEAAQSLVGDDLGTDPLNTLIEAATAKTKEAEAAALAMAASRADEDRAKSRLASGRTTRSEVAERLRQAVAAAEAARRAASAALQAQAAERARLEERSRSTAARLSEARTTAEHSVQTLSARSAAIDELETKANAEARRRSAAAEARDLAADRAFQAKAAIDAAERAEVQRKDEIQSLRERLRQGRKALADLVERQAALARHRDDAVDQPDALSAELDDLRQRAAGLEERAATLRTEREAAAEASSTAEKAHREADATLAAAREREEALVLQTETAAAALAGAREAGRQRLNAEPATLLEDEEIRAEADAADLAAVEGELARLEASRDRLGAVNLRAEQELEELREESERLLSESADLEAALAKLRRAVAELNGEGRERLLRAFQEVERHFGALFTQLFGGGKALLTLAEDANDPLGAGLDLAASPPGKRLQALSLLSGGEKALTAVALIFAFFRTQPAPLCVLDEVDAPLDDANVARLGDLMVEVAASTGTRFLVVTHHPLTMARMDRLYGVTMLERGLSALVSVQFDEAVALKDSA